MADFQKILIANRGEIAIRVMRAANELGKRTVAVYAEEDKLGLHRFKADEAYKIGEGLGPVAAYLSIEEILRVAKACGADAIHPGYGLLSENPNFVDACTEAGIAFIGPKAKTMRQLGDKASARRVAIQAGVPVIPATEVLDDNMVSIKTQAATVGYPLMLKASWGGGGRGMRPIYSEQEIEEKVLEGRREAEAAFGNSEGYLERMIKRARHVEVQVLGDKFGSIYHLYERDCSVQRRNQKVWRFVFRTFFKVAAHRDTFVIPNLSRQTVQCIGVSKVPTTKEAQLNSGARGSVNFSALNRTKYGLASIFIRPSRC